MGCTLKGKLKQSVPETREVGFIYYLPPKNKATKLQAWTRLTIKQSRKNNIQNNQSSKSL